MTNEELLGEVSNLMDSLTKRFEDRVEAQTTKINLKIENDVSRRIEALFDGYKLTHEKQWELERNLMALEKRIEQLEIKVS